jgi:integrase
VANIRTRKKKDGSTAYQVQVRITGFPTRTETFKTEREAKRWARSVEVEMDEGRHFRTAEARRRSLSAAIERYLAEEVPKKKKPEHKPKAQGQMHKSCLRWWGEQIGDVKLSEITVPLVVEYRDKLARTPYVRAKPDAKRTLLKEGEQPKEYPRSAGSVNSHLRVLSHLFTVARKQWHWVSHNPVQDVAPLPVRKRPVRVLSDDERTRLLTAVADHPLLQLLVTLALHTAARAGELLALRWRSVELLEDKSGKTCRLVLTDTKGDEPRVVWVHGEALRLLNRRRAERVAEKGGDCIADELVFPGNGRGRFDYAPPFAEAKKAAGVTGFKFHNLRSSSATYLAAQGASEREIKAIGGWKSNAVNRYVKHAAIDTRATMQRLADKLSAKD